MKNLKERLKRTMMTMLLAALVVNSMPGAAYGAGLMAVSETEAKAEAEENGSADVISENMREEEAAEAVSDDASKMPEEAAEAVSDDEANMPAETEESVSAAEAAKTVEPAGDSAEEAAGEDSVTSRISENSLPSESGNYI